jgi:hypothetical protein
MDNARQIKDNPYDVRKERPYISESATYARSIAEKPFNLNVRFTIMAELELAQRNYPATKEQLNDFKPYDTTSNRPAIGLPMRFVKMIIEFFGRPENSNSRAVRINEKELYLRN